MSNIAAVRKFEIAPDNQTSGNSTWSYRNGNPIITFQIAPNEYYVRSKNLKLCFDVTIKDGNGVAPNNNNQNGVAAGVFVPSEVRINSRVGVASLFSQLEINNAMNQNLETIRHYGRLLGSLLPSGSGWNEYTSYLSNEFAVSSNEQVQGRYSNNTMSCAMPIMAGIFLQGSDIPLSMDNGIGGLNLKFSLQSSIQSLFGDTATNSYYEISNVSLMGEYAMPAGGKLPAISSYPFSGFSSFYGVINNNDQTTQINPSLSAVVSTFTNFVPTPHISNYSEDGMKTTPLLNKNIAPGSPYNEIAPITKISYMRGGVLFPLQFQLDENEVINENAAVANPFALSAYDAQRQYYFAMSIRPRTSNAVDQLAGQNSENFATANADTQHNSVTNEIVNADPNYFQNVYGIGIRVGDMLGVGNTANYKNTSYSMRVISKLNGFSPMSSYTFFLYRSVINYDNNGLVSIIN